MALRELDVWQLGKAHITKTLLDIMNLEQECNVYQRVGEEHCINLASVGKVQTQQVQNVIYTICSISCMTNEH